MTIRVHRGRRAPPILHAWCRFTAVRGSLLVLAALLQAACSSSGGRAGSRAPVGRADMITEVEIRRTNYTNAYDIVRALRSRWLQNRGPTTILGQQGEVQVHLDDTRLGGVATLRNVPATGLVFIQWLDPITASQRWGLGYNHGAIFVSTRPP